MNWSSSGIRNTFEFEAIDNRNLDLSHGFIDGIVGGTITDVYRGDYRSTATLELDGARIPENCLIRVWHIAELDGEVYREELGTFMQDKMPLDYLYGRYTGSIDLYSTLLRLGTDRRTGDKKIPANTNIVDHFKSVVTDAYGTPYVSPALDATKTTKKVRVWEHNESALTECHNTADSINGFVTTDTHGRTCLVPYVNPSKRPKTFEIPSGSDSLTLLGVGISTNDMVNKVHASYRQNDTTYAQSATVTKSHPWAREKVGRWITEEIAAETLDLSNASASEINSALLKKAEQELASKADYSRKIAFTMLYMPITAGEVGRFVYADSDYDEGFDLVGLLSQREIHLTPTMEMECTMEEIL